jgi:ATP/maltotriose-dependent transcriptional regulator MalT
MREDAAWAYALLPDASPWCSVACLLEGTACLLAGERHEAARQLEEGAHRAAVALPAVHALCLAQVAVLEIDHGDGERATELSGRARAEVDRHKLCDNATVALVYAVAALARVGRGSIDAARRDLQDAERLQQTFTDFPGWYEAEVGSLLARATVRLGDLTGARARLAEYAIFLKLGLSHDEDASRRVKAALMYLADQPPT